MKRGKDKKNRSFDSKSSSSSPNGKRTGNSPKRCRTEGNHPSTVVDNTINDNLPSMDCSILDNVASQVTIVNTLSSSSLDRGNNSRLEFINSQKKNRYTSSNHPPFLVHVESTEYWKRSSNETGKSFS